jgi:hypothetical protein
VVKPELIPKKKIDAIRKERQELARKVQYLAYEETVVGGTRFNLLGAAAEAIEQMASEAGKGSIVVERDHKDPARPFAIIIAKKFDQLFGSPLYGETSTITSVALNCAVPWTRVRDWMKPKARNSARGSPQLGYEE